MTGDMVAAFDQSKAAAIDLARRGDGIVVVAIVRDEGGASKLCVEIATRTDQLPLELFLSQAAACTAAMACTAVEASAKTRR
jgi:hypothetical protein